MFALRGCVPLAMAIVASDASEASIYLTYDPRATRKDYGPSGHKEALHTRIPRIMSQARRMV